MSKKSKKLAKFFPNLYERARKMMFLITISCSTRKSELFRTSQRQLMLNTKILSSLYKRVENYVTSEELTLLLAQRWSSWRIMKNGENEPTSSRRQFDVICHITTSIIHKDLEKKLHLEFMKVVTKNQINLHMFFFVLFLEGLSNSLTFKEDWNITVRLTLHFLHTLTFKISTDKR